MFPHRNTIIFTFLLLCMTQAIHSHFMMKAMLHGAAMSMMMRPRILPIPIPVSANMISGFTDMMSGFRRQFDSPRVVVIQPRRPQPKVIIIQNDQQQCCGGWQEW